MKAAIKVRSVRKGTGTVYRLDPPYEYQGEKWEYAIAKSYKAEVRYGFFGLSPASFLFLVTPVKEASSYRYGPKLLDLDVTKSEAAILKTIEYVIKPS